jgi:hypothetical protein
MDLEKSLTLASMIIAGLLLLIFALDLALGFPFGRANLVLDILFALGAALVLWQGIETYREYA